MAEQITRAMVQSFLDGMNAGKGKKIIFNAQEITNWLANHPLYPQDDLTIQAIIADLASYRQ